MLAQQRQARIVGELGRHGALRAIDLRGPFGVSDITGRRDA
jgi:DeoR/GlpR family transcriptional regulator of sugar metabolism